MRQNQSLAVNGVVLSVTAKRTLNSIIVSSGVIANWQTKTVFSWLYVQSVTELCTIEDCSKENSRQRHKEPTWKTTNAQERNFERDMEGVLTNDIYFVVEGEPIPWRRPRFNGKTKVIFEDSKVKDFKARVQTAYYDEIQYQPMRFEKDEPIEMVVNFYLQTPKSVSKKTLFNLITKLRPTKRPDGDNLYKGVADALNGIAYPDDSQIVSGTFRKFWSEQPKTEITIRKI